MNSFLLNLVNEIENTNEWSSNIMIEIRKKYTNTNTMNVNLTKLRSYLHEKNYRNTKYEESLKKAFEMVQGNVNDMDMLHEFSNLDVKSQLRKQKMAFDDCNPNIQKLRDAILSIQVKPECTECLKLNQSEINYLVKLRDDRLLKKSESVVKIPKVDVCVSKAKEFIRQAKNCNIEDLASAIALLSGRRCTEIFEKGSFEASLSDRYYVIFRGQLKTLDHNLTYEIPVLCPGHQIEEALHILQERTRIENKGMIPAKKIQTSAKSLLKNDTIVFHDLRMAYSLITFEVFKPHDYSLNAWTAKFLGHTGLNTSTHYTKMQIEGTQRIRIKNIL